MKLFVQETRSSLILKYLFAINDVTMQWLPLSGKFVHKANRAGKGVWPDVAIQCEGHENRCRHRVPFFDACQIHMLLG